MEMVPGTGMPMENLWGCGIGPEKQNEGGGPLRRQAVLAADAMHSIVLYVPDRLIPFRLQSPSQGFPFLFLEQLPEKALYLGKISCHNFILFIIAIPHRAEQ